MQTVFVCIVVIYPLQGKIARSYLFFSLLLTTTLFFQCYTRIGILLTCGEHFYECIISLIWESWPHKTSLTPPHFVEEAGAKSGEWMVMYMCASGVKFASVRFDVGTVPTGWYYLLFILLLFVTFRPVQFHCFIYIMPWCL